MLYRLLFDAHCVSCSRVARLVRDLEIEDLEVASLHHPDIRQTFDSAGLPVPDKPTLIATDGTRLRVWTGVRMRVHLARLIGLRHTGVILRLLGAEMAAHAAQTPGTEGRNRGLRRRGLLAGAAAGIAAAVLGRATAASAEPHGDVSATPLGAQLRDQVMASAPAREAAVAWGPIDPAGVSLVTAKDGARAAALPHTNSSAVTYMTIDSATPIGLTLVADAKFNVLRYHQTSGRPLVELTSAPDGTVHTKNLVEAGGQAVPDTIATFAACLAVCLGAKITNDCFNVCVACARGGLGALVNCPLCTGCAGVNGARCAYDCRGYL